MFVFSSLVSDGYAQLMAHPITSTAVGSATAFVLSWLITQTRTRL